MVLELKEKEVKQEKKVFLSYEDEEGNKISGIVILVSQTDNTITFRTHKSEITIPVKKIIKLKKALEGEKK